MIICTKSRINSLEIRFTCLSECGCAGADEVVVLELGAEAVLVVHLEPQVLLLLEEVRHTHLCEQKYVDDKHKLFNCSFIKFWKNQKSTSEVKVVLDRTMSFLPMMVHLKVAHKTSKSN